ncbi:MAG TPA: DUF202 domain-containing protein [Actinomycetota bacterium]|nr:DUF202 domain-containing protein [Actinomycetota bacterium]
MPAADKDPGVEPDARFSFANERTFLAWNRTALALIVAGLAIVQVLPEFDLPGGSRIIGIPMIVLGGTISFSSYGRWRANEQALRTRSPLPPSRLPWIVVAGITAGAVLAIVIEALAGSGG